MDVTEVIPKDAIPSIDDPTFGAGFRGDGTDRVVVPDVPGEASRAYPLRILNFHEIANDTIGDTPVAVTWCPLCGTIVVFDRRIGDRTLTFGVSGKLAADNLVMYDRETGSEWKQSLGRCIDGEMAGTRLSVLPAMVTTWAQYRRVVTEPVVLQETDAKSEAASPTDEPTAIDYDRNPYRRYFESEGFGLAAHRSTDPGRTWNRADLDPKTRVIGVGKGNRAVAVPRSWLVEAGRVTTVSAGTDVVVFGTKSGLYAYEAPGFEFERASEETFEGDRRAWDAVTGRSEHGRQLTRVPSREEFAFTWQDDHGADAFHDPR